MSDERPAPDPVDPWAPTEPLPVPPRLRHLAVPAGIFTPRLPLPADLFEPDPTPAPPEST